MILQMLATEEMCDLNVQNMNGDTALHIAIKERMPVKCIKELTFNKSCNPIIINHDGMTPLQLAFNQISAVEVLLQCIHGKCSHEDIAKATHGSSAPCYACRQDATLYDVNTNERM